MHPLWPNTSHFRLCKFVYHSNHGLVHPWYGPSSKSPTKRRYDPKQYDTGRKSIYFAEDRTKKTFHSGREIMNVYFKEVVFKEVVCARTSNQNGKWP